MGSFRRQRPLLSVAPMAVYTDRHFRVLMRQLTRRTLLYTEMITTGAILHGDRERILGFSPQERPLALQLGGDDPQPVAVCAKIAEELGYDEVNLNVGCPSPRVTKGHFGACLMRQPQRVAECVAAMRASTALPVTVKHRIGVEPQGRDQDLQTFVRTVAEASCDRFIVHARVAQLSGLTPKQNRSIPPLRYDEVYRLKRDLPELTIEINGGITSLAAAAAHLRQVDGVMIGRAAYEDPALFYTADERIFGAPPQPPLDRAAIVEAMLPYLEAWAGQGQSLQRVTRHLLGLFHGQPGARRWRQALTDAQVTTERLRAILRGI